MVHKQVIVWLVFFIGMIGWYFIPVSSIPAAAVSSKVLAIIADANGDTITGLNGLYVRLSETLAGEDVLNDVIKTESRYTNIPVGGTTSRISTDQLYKTGPGYVKNISCFSDAAATAGTIVVFDNTVAGSGNVLWSFDVQAVGYPTPFVVPLEVTFSIGLFLDFTTTTDMFCTVSYR